MTEIIEQNGRTLEEIAEAINTGHIALEETLYDALSHAIQIGKDLLEAHARVGWGSWGSWLEENVTVPRATAANYMRLAEFEHMLPQDMKSPTTRPNRNGTIQLYSPVGKAITYLKTIGAISQRKGTPVRTDHDEIRRLHSEGLTQGDIARVLGVSRPTVQYALMPPSEQKRFRVRKQQLSRRRHMLLKQAERAESARRAGGDISEAYSLLRKCLQIAQSASDALPPSEARRSIRSALADLHRAEDHISRAIRESHLSDQDSVK